jgi:hypothetical protein
MLTISLDRIDDLLEQASELQIEVDFDGDDAAVVAVETANLAAVLADEPGYVRFAATLAALTTEEVYELLALSLLARSDASADEWPVILEEVRALPEESLRDRLARALLLGDDIETALERLGIFMVDEESEDEEEDEEDEEGSAVEDGEDDR